MKNRTILRIPLKTLKNGTFRQAPTGHHDIWLQLCGWCVLQDNGGVIPSAKNWSDKFTLWVTGGADKQLLGAPSPLWHWDGDTLIIDFYPGARATQVAS